MVSGCCPLYLPGRGCAKGGSTGYANSHSCTDVALDTTTGQGPSRLARPQQSLHSGITHRANHDSPHHSTTHIPALRCHDFFRLPAPPDCRTKVRQGNPSSSSIVLECSS